MVAFDSFRYSSGQRRGRTLYYSVAILRTGNKRKATSRRINPRGATSSFEVVIKLYMRTQLSVEKHPHIHRIVSARDTALFAVAFQTRRRCGDFHHALGSGVLQVVYQTSQVSQLVFPFGKILWKGGAQVLYPCERIVPCPRFTR